MKKIEARTLIFNKYKTAKEIAESNLNDIVAALTRSYKQGVVSEGAKIRAIEIQNEAKKMVEIPNVAEEK